MLPNVRSSGVESLFNCCISTSVPTPGGCMFSSFLAFTTPTFPLFLSLFVLSAHAKNLKKIKQICNFFFLLVSSSYERSSNRTCNPRTNFVAGLERQTGLRRILRLKIACLYSGQSVAFQNAQIGNYGQKFRDAIDKNGFSVQLEKLFGYRQRINGMLRKNQGGQR